MLNRQLIKSSLNLDLKNTDTKPTKFVPLQEAHTSRHQVLFQDSVAKIKIWAQKLLKNKASESTTKATIFTPVFSKGST